GQVGPEVAELVGWPQATAVRALTVDPAARSFTAERETDDGFETVTGPLPAVITAAEDIAEERFPNKAARQAAARKPIATVAVAGLGLAADAVGAAGSPTWVAGIEEIASGRRGEVLAGESPQALAAALGERLRTLRRAAAAGGSAPALPARTPGR